MCHVYPWRGAHRSSGRGGAGVEKISTLGREIKRDGETGLCTNSY
jgi:hypothetical protein